VGSTCTEKATDKKALSIAPLSLPPG
jgi:hypothetical protein